MWQTIIVILIVAGAGLYVLRRFRRTLSPGKGSSCGCGCGQDQTQGPNLVDIEIPGGKGSSKA